MFLTDSPRRETEASWSGNSDVEISMKQTSPCSQHQFAVSGVAVAPAEEDAGRRCVHTAENGKIGRFSWVGLKHCACNTIHVEYNVSLCGTALLYFLINM